MIPNINIIVIIGIIMNKLIFIFKLTLSFIKSLLILNFLLFIKLEYKIII